MLRPVTKSAVRVEDANEIYPAIRRAFQIARSGAPGPAAVEIPAQFLLERQEISGVGYEPEPELGLVPERELVERAAAMLACAEAPALYLGKGAAGAAALLVPLAEQLGAPVTTSFGSKGVFPESHALWLWPGFGRQAPGFVRRITESCDCLLAVGCRFGEVTTGGFGFEPPEALIHVDIEPEVLNRNYPAALAVSGDARLFVEALGNLIEGNRPWASLAKKIAEGHVKVNAPKRQRLAGNTALSLRGAATALP